MSLLTPLVATARREFRPMVRIALPVAIAEVGWVSMQIVDVAMVGRLGAEAIGAVGIGSIAFFAFGVPGMGFLLGLDTLVSQAFGGGRHAECDRWLRHGLCLAIGLTVPLTGVAWLVGLSLNRWGFDPAVLDLTRPYFAIVTWSLLPLLLYAAFRHYLQAVAVVAPVMFALVSANLINAAVNWVLVFGHLGAPALGVEGAAWATCISRLYMAAVLGVTVVAHRTTVWPLAAGVGAESLRRLLALGGPAAAQRTLEFGAFAAVTALAGLLEPATLAAHHIVTNLAGLTFMVPLGISSATAVRVGHGIGRRDATSAAGAGWMGIALGAGFMTLAAAVFVSVPRPILRIFILEPMVVDTGVVLLLVAAVFQIFDGLQVVATGALRGLGDTRTPMLLNLAGHWIIGLPVGYALCFYAGWGVVGLWIGLSVGLILVGAVLLGTWRRRERALPDIFAERDAVSRLVH